MKKSQLALIGVTLLTLFAYSTALAQSTLELSLQRTRGYGGFGGDIQGLFTLTAEGPASLEEVRFRLDGGIIEIDNEAPFQYRFETGQYEPGTHTLSATGILTDGTEIESNEITRRFLSDEEARDAIIRTIVPLLVIVGGVSLIGVLGPLMLGKKKAFVLGKYGMAGGAVCPKCELPFSRNTLAPNLVVGKLERCPHCGKWSIVPRADRASLEIAENKYRARDEAQMPAAEQSDSLEKLIEESRFDD